MNHPKESVPFIHLSPFRFFSEERDTRWICRGGTWGPPRVNFCSARPSTLVARRRGKRDATSVARHQYLFNLHINALGSGGEPFADERRPPPRWASCRRHYSDTERSGIRQSREPIDYRGIGVIIGVQRRCEKGLQLRLIWSPWQLEPHLKRKRKVMHRCSFS